MVKNVILVQIHETNNYSWFSMYLENEEGKINIFGPLTTLMASPLWKKNGKNIL